MLIIKRLQLYLHFWGRLFDKITHFSGRLFGAKVHFSGRLSKFFSKKFQKNYTISSDKRKSLSHFLYLCKTKISQNDGLQTIWR